MLSYLAENIGTVIAALLLFAVVAAVVASIIRDRKKGKSSCGCSCEHCSMTGACHKTK